MSDRRLKGWMVAKSGRKRLRSLWLQIHKWIGLSLAVLIIPICLTGSALVWHDWLDAKLEPQRHATYGEAGLTPSAYAAAARATLAPDQKIASLRFGEDGKPVVVTAMKPLPDGASGRPERTNIWIDPTNGAIVDTASASSGMVQVMHVLHGSMMIPGGWGRPIVGWVGVFMLLSSISGIWLWWPLSGSFRGGLRWKRRNMINANLHYQMGFWILIPLAMLSFTGAWISFPKVFSQLESRPAPGGQDRSRSLRAVPLDAPATGIDAAVAAAQPFATGRLTAISWPTDQKAAWKVSYARKAGPAEVLVGDGSGAVTPPKPPQPETLARTMRRWHDGTGMGLGWQIVIFLGGLIPAALSVTGIIIWWRSRKPRGRAQNFRRLAEAAE